MFIFLVFFYAMVSGAACLDGLVARVTAEQTVKNLKVLFVRKLIIRTYITSRL